MLHLAVFVCSCTSLEKSWSFLNLQTMVWHCKFCDSYFLQRNQLNVHQSTVHQSEMAPVRNHICLICGEGFEWFGDLKKHSRNHRTECSEQTCVLCERCGKMISRESFRNHKYIHSTDRSWSCNVCGASFRSRPSLSVHKRSHSDVKLFQCEVCGKSLATSAVLKRHQMTHLDTKPWSCNVCDKSFSTHEDLRKHRLRHTNERPFQCTFCYRRFVVSYALKVHLRTHTKEKPFSCKDCGKTFSHKVSLTKYHHCPKAPVKD